VCGPETLPSIRRERQPQNTPGRQKLGGLGLKQRSGEDQNGIGGGGDAAEGDFEAPPAAGVDALTLRDDGGALDAN
jgi:hypothetical protein